MANKNFRVKHGLEVAGSATVEADLTVTGNLTVNGTTTTLNTETLAVEDNIVVLNSNVTGTPSTNAGIEIERGTSTNSALTWNESDDKWYQDRAGVSTVLPVSTSELVEGTNLYYTTARANTDFDSRLATKSTTDLAEGTNLYYTDGRFDTRLATKSTTDLAEGTNLYYTDARVRAVVDNNVDLDVDGSNNVYVKTLRDGTRVNGALAASTDASYVFPGTVLTWQTDNNGFIAASSINGAAGNAPAVSYTHYEGDTLSAANSAAALNLQMARGNSVTGVTLPWTGTTSVAPSAVQNGDVLGTLNFNGYCTTDFSNRVGTIYQGGRMNTLHGMQYQAFAAENFSDSTLTIPAANITAVSSFRVAFTTPAVTGTKGQISFGTTTPAVGQAVRVTGTLTGNATGIVSGQNYWIIATNGSTTATLSATPGGLPIDTTGSTLTGLTLTRCGVTLTISGQTKFPYGRNSILSISGLNNVTNGDYPVGGIPTLTSVVLGIPHAVAPTLSGSQAITTTAAYMASGYRFRAFPTATPANTSNRISLIDHTAATATLKSDQYNFQGGTNTFNYLTANASAVTAQGSFVVKDLAGTTTYATVDATKASFTRPVQLPTYTAVALRAVTGAVGYMAAVSDSASGSRPNGSIAFWDTTNTRWSYIHDNQAV